MFGSDGNSRKSAACLNLRCRASNSLVKFCIIALFTDMLYLCKASSLSPRHIMKLLNNLTVFSFGVVMFRERAFFIT